MTNGANFKLDGLDQQATRHTRRTGMGASAALVNRTHRVIHERAKLLQARRSKVRSLWIPLAVSGALLLVLAFALWTAFEEYESSPAGLPDTSQMLVLIMWSVPLSAMLLAVVWSRHARSENERAR